MVNKVYFLFLGSLQFGVGYKYVVNLNGWLNEVNVLGGISKYRDQENLGQNDVF